MTRPWQACILTVVIVCSLLVPAMSRAEAEPEDRTLQPHPAEIMPMAVKSTLLDIVYTGERFIAVGDRGHILVSGDGLEWTQVNVPVRAMLTRIRMMDASTGWVVGHDGTVLGTQDGGLTWSLLHFDAEWGKPFYDLLFLDKQTGMVIGSNGRMIRTADGGQSWEDIDGSIMDLGLHLNVILKLADGTLFIAGERSLLARSVDNGDSWSLLTSPYSGSWFNAFPYGEKGAVAFGLRGNIYLSEDVTALATENLDEWDEYGVVTQTDPAVLKSMGWLDVQNPVVQSLFGGTQLEDGQVILVGVNGTIITGDPKSGKLAPVKTSQDAPLSSAVLVNNTLYVVGRNGVDSIAW